MDKKILVLRTEYRTDMYPFLTPDNTIEKHVKVAEFESLDDAVKFVRAQNSYTEKGTRYLFSIEEAVPEVRPLWHPGSETPDLTIRFVSLSPVSNVIEMHSSAFTTKMKKNRGGSWITLGTNILSVSRKTKSSAGHTLTN